MKLTVHEASTDLIGEEATLVEVSQLLQVCETVCDGRSWYEVKIHGNKPVGGTLTFEFTASFRFYDDLVMVRERIIK